MSSSLELSWDPGDFPSDLAFPLDQVLDDLARDYLPSKFPPQIAGAAIWDDIWNAVKQLGSFLSYPNALMGWLWDNVVMKLWNHIWSTATWFWDNAIQPSLRWVYDRIWQTWEWFWVNALQPPLQWIYDRVWQAAQWFWDNAIGPGLQWVWDRVGEMVNWLWSNALQPSLQWLWARVEEVWGWWWENALQPALRWVYDHIWGTVQWFWDNAISPGLRWVWETVWEVGHWIVDNVALPALDWLWENIQTKLDEFWDWLVEQLKDLGETITNITIAGAQALGEGFQTALTWLFNHVFDPFADSIRVKSGIPRKLLTGQYESAEQLLDDFEDPLPWGSIAAYGLMIPGAILGLIGASSEAGQILFTPAVQEVAKIVARTIPSFGDLRDAYLRELMPEETHDEWLGRAGYSEENIGIIKDLYFEIPTPSDLVRMAVREVFSPEVVERFGLFDEFPAEFAKWARQIGISEFWAKGHWGAHWGLPSVTQAFEMFHRDVIDEETLGLLLRVQDVMPFWRDKLTQIAYRPVGRIDTRRLFRTGVWTEERVYRSYLDQGYAPEDARAVTDYVVRDAAGIDKDAPRETIVGAYRDRLLTRAQAETELLEAGFPADVVALFLEQADLAVEKQNTALAEDIVEADFRAGAVTEASARSQLLALNLPEARVDLLLELWSRKAAVRTVTLSASQLLRLHREGLMPEATLRERLAIQGYNDTDVDYLVQLSPEEPPAEPRTLTVGQVRTAFRGGVIDLSEYTGRLQDLGYPPEDISVLVDLDQPAEIVEVKVLTVSQLQRAFRRGFITEGDLRDGLRERGYSEDQVDVLVALAQPEVAVRARELTVGQLQRAHREGVITEAEIRSRLRELGYSGDAADVLVQTSLPPAVAPPRELSVSQLQRALRAGLLSEAEVGTQLQGLGYSSAGVSVLVALARPEELVLERDLTVAQLQRAFREGLLPEDELRRRLADMGFSALDVEILVDLARPEVA